MFGSHAILNGVAHEVERLDWNQLRSFVAVAEDGSLTRAARRLRLSQPTVGRHIRALEEAVGETLFERLPEGFALTGRGELLLGAAEEMNEAFRRVEQAAAGDADAVEGTVRLAVSEVFGIEVVPTLLEGLAFEHPRLELELVVGDDTVNLLRRVADVAVRHVAPGQQGLIARRVGGTEVGLFASRSYLERHPELVQWIDGHSARIDLADFERHTVIGFDRREMGLLGARAVGLDVERRDFRLRSDSIRMQMAMVEAGLGVGSYQVLLARRRPQLVRLLPEVTLGQLEIWLVAHDDLQRSRRVRVVWDHLAERLGDWLRDGSSTEAA